MRVGGCFSNFDSNYFFRLIIQLMEFYKRTNCIHWRYGVCLHLDTFAGFSFLFILGSLLSKYAFFLPHPTLF